jgi:hypothetical protein
VALTIFWTKISSGRPVSRKKKLKAPMAIANAIGTLSANSTSMTTAGIQVVMSRPCDQP